MEPCHLFVYGTLRKGFHNKYARLLHSRAAFVGRARIPGRLYDLGWHPGAVASRTTGEWVRGEIFRLANQSLILPILDAYEGPSFERVSVTAQLDSGRERECWVYLWIGNRTGRPIPSGVWSS